MIDQSPLITPAVPDPPEVQRQLWEGFSPSELSFDIGANCGQTFDHIHRFSDHVVAFEPSEEAERYLFAHFADVEWLTIRPWAVSSVTGMIELVAIDEKIDTGQLVTAGTPGMEWSAALGNGRVREVYATTLDSFVDRTNKYPDFLKIDVEGHEAMVLQGASKVLDRGVEMLIEIHSEDLGASISDLLRDRYDVTEVRHPHYPAGSELWRTHYWLRCFPLRKTREA